MAAALQFLWTDPAVRRVLVEPDVRNERIRAINRWAGFREVGEAPLPGKTACVSVLERPAARHDDALSRDTTSSAPAQTAGSASRGSGTRPVAGARAGVGR